MSGRWRTGAQRVAFMTAAPGLLARATFATLLIVALFAASQAVAQDDAATVRDPDLRTEGLAIPEGSVPYSIPDDTPSARAARLPAGATIDVAAGATIDVAAGQEALQSVVCPFKDEIDYDAGEISCGLLSVPENREVANSRTIRLLYIKLSARDPEVTAEDEAEEVPGGIDLAPGIRPDPVIYLTGGPGVAAGVYVERFKDHGLLDHRDLYILEQRGIQNSGDFCPFFGTVDLEEIQPRTFEDFNRATLESGRRCFDAAEAAGVDLRGYNTFENARDVKALRQALGFEEWNVWGISYGSVLGQALLKVDPEGTRAAVLDAIVPLDIQDLMRIGRWYRRSLDRFRAACDAQEDCATAYPDFEITLEEAVESVRDDPLAVEVDDTELYPDGVARFFPSLVAGLPFSLFYEESNHAAMPALMSVWAERVLARDPILFEALAVAGGMGGGPSVSQGMGLAVRCQDGYIDAMVEDTAEDMDENGVFGLIFGGPEAAESFREACREYGLPRRDWADYAPVRTDVPSVIVNGAWDPITPPPLAEYVAEGFTNGRYVEFPHAGHGPTRSMDCGGDFLNAFFDDPEGDLDTSCAEKGGEQAVYLTRLFETHAAPMALIKMADGPMAMALPALWGGLSALVLLLAALVYPGGWLARTIDGRLTEATGGARFAGWLTGLAGSAFIGGMGFAAYQTTEYTEALVLLGLVPWAGLLAWTAPVAGVLGLLVLFLTIRARAAHTLPIATLIGLLLTGAAGIALAAFAFVWDLWPI